MKSRRRNVSDDHQTIRRRSSRLKSDELLLNILIDLVIEIFSRLPLKSIARCRCVSKRWSSILRRSDFTELFLSKSSAHPQIMFARQTKSEVIFFSSPQPQNIDENLSTIAVDHHMSVPFECVYDVSSSVNGYVCLSHDRMLKGRKTPELVYVVCNPSTRQCFTLPKVKTGKRTRMRSYLGYDPVEKQHKVLAMIWQLDGVVEHQVLTLGGTSNLTWRMTECGIHHSFPRSNSICINGVLYYTAKASNGDDMIVCFDVRSEKYSFVKAVKSVFPPTTLVIYNGKLASLKAQPYPYFFAETSTSFEMWILEDPEKHEWSNHVFKLPSMWKDVVAGETLFFKGVTATNEIVLTPIFSSDRYHVYYYNFDKETITKVQIQGMGAFDRASTILTLLNHVEDVKLM